MGNNFRYATPTHSVVSAGTSSKVALAANTDRRYALFVNDSDTNLYLALSTGAAANTGIRLNANGGNYEINATNMYYGVVNVFSTTASKNLLVTEGE